jgi:hypothetical protein
MRIPFLGPREITSNITACAAQVLSEHAGGGKRRPGGQPTVADGVAQRAGETYPQGLAPRLAEGNEQLASVQGHLNWSSHLCGHRTCA